MFCPSSPFPRNWHGDASSPNPIEGWGQKRGDDVVDLPGSLWRGRQLEKRENLTFRGRSIHGTIWGKRGGATGVLCAGWLRLEETSKGTQAVSIIHLANFFSFSFIFLKICLLAYNCFRVVHCPCVLSRFIRVRHFVTPQRGAPHAPLSMGSSRQEYCSELPCPPPGDLPDPEAEPVSLMQPRDQTHVSYFSSVGRHVLYH